MSHSMQHEHAELLNLQSYAGENPNKANSSELIKREQLEGTPFEIIYQEDKGYWLAMGMYRLSDVYEDRTECIDLLITNQWDVVFRMIACISESIVEKTLQTLKAQQ